MAGESLATSFSSATGEDGGSGRIRVTGRGYVSHGEAVREMKSATAVLLLGTDDSFAMGTPGKTYDYLGSARPIICLAVPDSSAARLVISAEGGWVAHPNDVEEIAELITDVHRRWRGNELREPLHPRRDVLLPYTRPELTRRLASVFDRVTS